jgi:Protein of unknown function (DUF1566)
MSVGNFLKEAVDADAINHYLRMLAERQLQAEQINMALNDCLQLSKQTSSKVERQEEHIKQLQTQINSVNTELNQLKPRSKVIENPIERFIVDRNGTAIDNATGLMWCRYAIGQKWHNDKAIGDGDKMDWYEAMKIVVFFNQNACSGFSDWRLPSLEELQSIIEKDKSPTINHTAFPNTPREMFWSSSSMINNQHAWFVSFISATWHSDLKSNKNAVRLVR